MFRKAEARHARAFRADGQAINEKVRLYAQVGAALIAARENGQDAFEAIGTVIPWERFCETVAEAQALSRSEEFDPFQMLGEHYAGVRRWSPAFLATFTFQGVPAAASLLRAINVLREMNAGQIPNLSKSPRTGFVRERWARHVFTDGVINKRYYELCVLSELRDRLRAGDVWVAGSRRYRSFEERLISPETLRELEVSGTLPVAVDADFERFIDARRGILDDRQSGSVPVARRRYRMVVRVVLRLRSAIGCRRADDRPGRARSDLRRERGAPDPRTERPLLWPVQDAARRLRRTRPGPDKGPRDGGRLET